MTLSPELLDKAKAASRQVADAERRVMLARGEYHAAIRRLHLAGGPLREIARALALSHQRVQQIVSGAGGTWWRHVWRTRTIGPDATCTWCGRPPSEVGKLIAGPNVFICDACVESAERTGASGRAASGPFSRMKARSIAARCSFCGKRATDDRTLSTAPAGNVCSDCLRVCREILDAAEPR